MSELVPLRLHVAGVLLVGRLDDGHALVHAQSVAFEADHLAWIVGDWTNGLETEVEENLRPDAVLAQIGLEAESLVGFDSVGAAVLKLVRLELVQETDAASFLIEIDNDAASIGGDHPHGFMQLPSAVAAQRVEDIAGQALRVHAHQYFLAVGDVAVDERDMLVLIDVVAIADDLPGAMLRRQSSLGDAMDEPLVLQSVRDQLSDRDEGDLVIGGELLELRPPSR